jgi:archaellum component FlaG (FlaF/FlaG flagellin family)
MNKRLKTIVTALAAVIVFIVGMIVGGCIAMTLYEATETISFPKNDTVYFYDTIYFPPQ